MAKDTGTVNIHGKEYKTVAARVQEFREKYEMNYSIETEIIEANETLVVMKATIRANVLQQDAKLEQHSWVVATGHAEEVRSSSQINRTSALENAETSAIGRALAAFGLAGTEYASADEVAQAITQQRTPAPKPQPATHQEHVKQVFPEAEAKYAVTSAEDKPPTQAQLDRIREIRKELGYPESQTETKIKLLKTQAQAGASVGKLKAELDEFRAKQGGTGDGT